MRKRRTGKKSNPAAMSRPKAGPRSKRQVVLAIGLASILLVAGVAMASRGSFFVARKPAPSSPTPPAPQGTLSLSKEYVYGPGGRVLATEEAPAASCSPTLSPTSQNFTQPGGTGSVAVTNQTGCAWTAASNDTWITITSGASGSGNGTVNYSVALNPTGSQRTGTITIANLTFTVTQDPCTFSISPTSQNFTTSGGSGSVTVTAAAGCTWNAFSNAAWVTITSGSSGTGNGTVNYTVAANSGAARNGTMTIAGLTFNVTQDGSGSGRIYPVAVSASNQLSGNEPDKAIDGNLATWWSAGNGPPQWIQLDLGQPCSITQIRLNVAQYPAGTTYHEILGGPQTTGLSLLAVLNGFTQGGQWLQVTSIRHLQTLGT